ncbi:hypothetical protein [Mesorhizobium sp. M0140]|uniref:hypothetical protein n=1 Tax=Mesorhizobium sp. M0140 TaxID=2956893 RepID=UPI003336C0B1
MGTAAVVLILLQAAKTDGWVVGKYIKTFDSMPACAAGRSLGLEKTDVRPEQVFCVEFTPGTGSKEGVTMLFTQALGSKPSEVAGRYMDDFESLTECNLVRDRALAKNASLADEVRCVDFTPNMTLDGLGRREVMGLLRSKGITEEDLNAATSP